MKHTTGTWSRDEDRRCYFLAGNFHRRTHNAGHRYLLVAVNEINDRTLDELEELARAGFRVLIDSGIFWLTNEHKRAHGITMDEALALAPDEIDGFEELFARYLRVVERLGDLAWGYIELDQGGRENKVKTRALLESHGIVPMPVYHPLNDGWDYFDQLAAGYDRLMVGNVVQADRATRLRIATTLWERHRAHPDLWLHMLGYTPHPVFAGWTPDSADSSTWLSGVRWAQGVTEAALMSTLGRLGEGREFRYRIGESADGPAGSKKATALAATTMRVMTANWRAHQDALGEHLGLDAYPPRLESEGPLQPKAVTA